MKRSFSSVTPNKPKRPAYGTKLKKKLTFGPPASKSFTSRVKEIIRNTAEAPHHSVWDITATSILHGNIYTSSLLTEIAQGTSNATRLGDEIFLEAFKTRFQIVTAPGLTTIAWRVMLIKSGIEACATLSGAWTTGGTAITAAEVFFNTNPGGDYNYPGRAIVNPKAATVLYDQVFQFDENLAAQNIVRDFQVTVPIKQKHVYNQATQYAKFKNYYWLVMAYQNGGTPGTTNCGNIGMQTDIIFKNEA